MTIPNNPRQTGAKAASAAGKALNSAKATKPEKSAAASALSQAPSSTGQTSAKAASAAGKTLANPKATKPEKSAAASALAQTPTRPKKK